MQVIVKPPAYHPGQLRMLTEQRRFNVSCMGRRFGKTRFCLSQLITERGGALDGKRCAWFAPTYKYISEVWKAAERQLGGLVRVANRSESRIELRTGGVIDFWTLEDESAGRGRKYHRVVVDEAAHARYLRNAWERSILPTLADYAGSAWIISTPNGLNYFHTLYQLGNPDNPKRDADWQSWQMPTWMNPHIPPEEIERQRSLLPSLVFAQEYEAKFVSMGVGMVRPDYLRVSRRAVEEGWRIGTGVDLAISVKTGADFTVIVTKAEDPETKHRHTIDVQRGRWTFNETQDKIKKTAERLKPSAIAIESTQYQAAAVQELVRTTRLPVFGVKPDRDKVSRFLPLLGRYEHGMEFHADDLPPYFEEELLAFPEGEHDDCVDAAVMADLAIDRCFGSRIAGAHQGRRV